MTQHFLTSSQELPWLFFGLLVAGLQGEPRLSLQSLLGLAAPPLPLKDLHLVGSAQHLTDLL